MMSDKAWYDCKITTKLEIPSVVVLYYIPHQRDGEAGMKHQQPKTITPDLDASPRDPIPPWHFPSHQV